MIFSIDFLWHARIFECIPPARKCQQVKEERNNDEHDLVMIIEWLDIWPRGTKGAIMCQTSCFIVTSLSPPAPFLLRLESLRSKDLHRVKVYPKLGLQ